MGRTLFEIYHDSEFQTQHHKLNASGLGLDALKEAHAVCKGAIIVSDRFGHWEAMGTVIKMQGLESRAVYKQTKIDIMNAEFVRVLKQEEIRFWQPDASEKGPFCIIYGMAVLFPSS